MWTTQENDFQQIYAWIIGIDQCLSKEMKGNITQSKQIILAAYSYKQHAFIENIVYGTVRLTCVQANKPPNCI